MEFHVKLDRFEGPYTKLLDMIAERKLSITEVSLVAIADDYIAYIKTLEQDASLDVSQFIVVASTLMLMKVKSLIPHVEYTEEEERQVHDLESALEMHALMTQGASHIRDIYGKHPLHTRSRVMYKGGAVFVPDARVTGTFLQSIALLTLASFIKPEQLVRVAVEQALRIEVVIERLLDRVRGAMTVTLEALADGAQSVEEKKKLLIVHFIALLELVRSGVVRAEQAIEGGDIVIEGVQS